MEKGTKIVLMVVVIVAALAVGMYVFINLSWQAGVFEPNADWSPKQSGFGVLRPVDWSCKDGLVTLSIVNGAGGQVTDVKARPRGGDYTACSPNAVGAGQTTTCALLPRGPMDGGAKYRAEPEISYISPEGIVKTDAGTISGTCE